MGLPDEGERKNTKENKNMKYYKALNDKDMIFPDRTKGLAFVRNELLTETELKKQCERNRWNFDKIAAHNFSTVEISKRQVYWFFGCRFA